MRKKRDLETPTDRHERLAQQAHERTERISQEDNALDAAVRNSIRLYGA